MKKLKLKMDGKQMLTKEQMKKISGGYACSEAGGIPIVVCMDWSNNIEYISHMYGGCDVGSGSQICIAGGFGFLACDCDYYW